MTAFMLGAVVGIHLGFAGAAFIRYYAGREGR